VSEAVLDASALLAMLHDEAGGEKVEPNLYHLLGHYVTVAKNGVVTEIISSTYQESVASFPAK